ncbi:hypothetical protein FA15DRAFT_40407 [Coprinopsis marcescibilis]|uniref:F-box domain-containing protein n=1 Tax=Coprinopsis marcescibilis TaxID=230819 RepID=A0A5C3L623_COPMA|nr:hypothetical protein FA15DRAFT_40407 [Coprinopsis marcescibilis]
MNIPKLPVELLDLTLGFLCNDKATLVSCSLACRRFRSRCQILLFESYRLSPIDSSPNSRSLDDLSSPQRLARALDTSPHLARSIKRLVFGRPSSHFTPRTGREKSVYDSCRRILPQLYSELVNLERLEYNASHSGSSWLSLPKQVGLGKEQTWVGEVLPVTHLSLRDITEIPLSWFHTFPKLQEITLQEVSFTNIPIDGGRKGGKERKSDGAPILVKRLNLAIGGELLMQFCKWISASASVSAKSLEEFAIAGHFVDRQTSLRSINGLYKGSATLMKLGLSTLKRVELTVVGAVESNGYLV